MRRMWATVALCFTLIAVAGCARSTAAKTEPPLPLAAPKGMAEVTPDQFVTFMPVVNRYFYVRKQAVLAGDPEVIWKAFPALKEGQDRQNGINAEADAIAGYRSQGFIDGNVQPESYARLKVLVDGDKAVVLVNGSETYLTSSFSDSGGQVQMLLYLETAGAAWTVIKTDETTLAEYHQAVQH